MVCSQQNKVPWPFFFESALFVFSLLSRKKIFEAIIAGLILLLFFAFFAFWDTRGLFIREKGAFRRQKKQLGNGGTDN